MERNKLFFDPIVPPILNMFVILKVILQVKKVAVHHTTAHV